MAIAFERIHQVPVYNFPMLMNFILFTRFTLEEYVAASVIASISDRYLLAHPTQGWMVFACEGNFSHDAPFFVLNLTRQPPSEILANCQRTKPPIAADA